MKITGPIDFDNQQLSKFQLMMRKQISVWQDNFLCWCEINRVDPLDYVVQIPKNDNVLRMIRK